MGTIVDLITVAEAKVEPVLSAVASDNARLLSLISIASIQIQRYIGYFYDASGDVPKDLKFACSQYVSYLWNQDQIGAAGDMESESLGQYSYNRGRNLGTSNARLDRILGLLQPHIRRSSPQIVKDDE